MTLLVENPNLAFGSFPPRLKSESTPVGAIHDVSLVPLKCLRKVHYSNYHLLEPTNYKRVHRRHMFSALILFS